VKCYKTVLFIEDFSADCSSNTTSNHHSSLDSTMLKEGFILWSECLCVWWGVNIN